MPIVSGYPYLIEISGKDYPVLADGYTLTSCVGAEGKHRTSSCQVKVMSVEVMQILMASTASLLEAKVKDSSGTVVFTGVIRPHVSVTVNQTHMDAVSIEVLDYTEKLHVKVYEKPEGVDGVQLSPTTIWSQDMDGCKVCAPDDTSNSLVHKLCALAGIEADDIDAPKIDITIPRFSLAHGDYLDEKLATVLYESIHDYRFDADGTLVVYQTGAITGAEPDADGNRQIASDLESVRTVTSLRKTLTVTRSDDIKDGAVIHYPRYETMSNVQLFEETKSSYSLIWDYQSVWWTANDRSLSWSPKGLPDGASDVRYSGWWLEGKDVSPLWSATYTGLKSKELKSCTQKGGVASWTVSAGSWPLAGLAGAGTVKYRMRVYADASYLVSSDEMIGVSGANCEDYTASVIADAASARSLMFVLLDRAKTSCITYSFDSFEKLTPGTVVTLKEASVSGISSLVRILSRKSRDDTGLYTYEAEGYGSPVLTSPTIDEGGEAQPQDQPDFFTLELSEDIIVPDPETDSIPIIAVVAGSLLDKYAGVPVWNLNGVALDDLYGLRTVQIDKSRFAAGSNRLSVSASYDGEDYRLDALVKNISTTLEVSMQYASLDDGDTPDAGTVWTDGQPDQSEGKVIWVRFRTSSSAEWIVLRMTGSDGKDGGDPVVYFQWAATPYIAPDEGYDLMGWSENVAIVVPLGDGKYMGFVANGGRWEATVPEKPADLNYLWVKYYSYQTESWDYFCTTGTPAMSFDLDVSPGTYRLTSRGCVAADDTQTDGCQKIRARVTKVNTEAPCTWTVDSDLVDWEYATDYSDAEIVVTIPTHDAAGDPLSLPSFTIHASIADIEVAKEFLVVGVQEGKAEMAYLGVYDSFEELSQVASTEDGGLIFGDHALVESDGIRKPYYWNGTQWVFAGADTPVSIAGKVMMDSLYDALHASTTQESMSVVDLFVANMAANNIFALYAQIAKLLAGPGNGTAGSGLRVRIGNLGADGSPIFDVMWGASTVFSVDPVTGNIFFGQPNSALTAPESGFMYSPDSKSIVSANGKIKISEEGSISMQGASISGDIAADSFSILDAASGLATSLSSAISTPSSMYEDEVVYSGEDDIVLLFGACTYGGSYCSFSRVVIFGNGISKGWEGETISVGGTGYSLIFSVTPWNEKPRKIMMIQDGGAASRAGQTYILALGFKLS